MADNTTPNPYADRPDKKARQQPGTGGASAGDHATRQGPPHRAGDTESGGIATPLHPGGTSPGGGPGAEHGSIGTGGGSTGNRATGSQKRNGD